MKLFATIFPKRYKFRLCRADPDRLHWFYRFDSCFAKAPAMGKYEPLTRHLEALPGDSWSTSFAEIERIIARTLPPSAYEHRPWWANQRGSNHTQARAWQAAGWEVRDIDLPHRTARFVRSVRQTESAAAASALWKQAAALTGISDRAELEQAALTALIRSAAGRALIELGGTMPDALAAPRERPWA